MSNPVLSDARRADLTKELMKARRDVGTALKSKEEKALKGARQRVDCAKRALGERGDVWWDDGAPDYNRYMARNSPYATWYAALVASERD